MQLYKSSLFMMFAVSAVLAVLVYLNGNDRKANRLLALYNLDFSAWCLFQFLGEIAPDRGSVLMWTRLNVAAAVFIPVVFLHLVWVILEKENSRTNRIASMYSAGAVFLALIPSRYFISALTSGGYFRYYPVGGPVYMLFMLFFMLLIMTGLSELVRAFISETGGKKNQIAYILLASAVGFGGGVLWFLPVFGVNIYPVGIFIVPLYLIIASYAIVKHNLLDIRIAIRKSIVYFIMFGALSAVYFTSMFFMLSFFNGSAGLNSFFPSAVILCLFAFLFEPIRNRLQRYADCAIFPGEADYPALLRSLMSSDLFADNMDEFASRCAEELAETFRTGCIAVLVDEDRSGNLILRSKKGFPDIAEGCSLGTKNIPQEEKIFTPDILADKDFRCMLQKAGACLCLKLFSNGGALAMIILGEKDDRIAWNSYDRSALEAFSAHASVAAENALLCSEISRKQFALYRAEKLAEIGTIAANVAHEIKNPLTAMKGLVGALPSNISDSEYISKFNDIVPRQIDRINQAVESLLKIARRNFVISGDRQTARSVNAEKVIDEILSLVRMECEKSGIKIFKEARSKLELNCEAESLTQAIMNIVINAMEAMPHGGEIRLTIEKDHMIISDSGEGIDENDINRIYEPFFTKKEKGIGIGLSTAQRLIREMGGKISVSSKKGFGTTFVIDFV